MQDWLFLLLPVAAASGWFAAKSHFTQKDPGDPGHEFRQAYCRGLNYLLSEKTDKAIDTFASLLESDRETIETHIALGNLFRRRGDLERAIEIHENLIQKGTLDTEQQALAEYELGLDYLRSGLFDRAEIIFGNLIDHPGRGRAALQQLLAIFQHEKEWQKAIECTRKLARLGKLPQGESVAQFLCELAEEALAAHRNDEAFHWLEQARAEDAGCVRANLLLARMRMRDGLYEEALVALKQVEAQDPAYIQETLEPLQICYERLNKSPAELMGYLGYVYETYGLESAALALARQLRTERGNGRAIEHLQRVLEAHPSLKTLNAMTGLLLEEKNGAQREALIRLDRAIDRLCAGVVRYRCSHCGFSGNELHWRCPSCRHWVTMRPVTAGRSVSASGFQPRG